MHMLLITIMGPHQSVDLQVPGELPVRDLLPTLLGMYGLPADTSSWGISHNNALLMDERSLLETEIPDGAILALQDKAGKTIQLEPFVHTNLLTPISIVPSPNTGGIGVTWSTEGLSPEP